jgi:hypothetical protein
MHAWANSLLSPIIITTEPGSASDYTQKKLPQWRWEDNCEKTQIAIHSAAKTLRRPPYPPPRPGQSPAIWKNLLVNEKDSSGLGSVAASIHLRMLSPHTGQEEEKSPAARC